MRYSEKSNRDFSKRNGFQLFFFFSSVFFKLFHFKYSGAKFKCELKRKSPFLVIVGKGKEKRSAAGCSVRGRGGHCHMCADS